MKHRTSPAAFDLWMRGVQALSRVEHAGVRVDRGYLDDAILKTASRIKDLESQMRSDRLYRNWRRRYGEGTKLSAPDQLAWLVFKDQGVPSKTRTEKGRRESATEKALEGVDLPIVKLYFQAQKLRKLHGTYLTGIQREMVRHHDGDWYVHPNYNLNTVITFRSSCDNPNYQNIYSRDPEFAETMRKCYIARRGRQLGENDYGQIEVRVPCPVTLDPNLIRYCSDPKTDMHRDMACQIFLLEPHQVSKAARHAAKNQYVFPTFYGSYYAQCAPNIWHMIESLKIKVEGTDTLLTDHLAEKGIVELGACDPDETPAKGTFERHLKEIEEDFWGNRFRVYAQWKRDWWDSYLRDGGFTMITGFAVNAPLDRKQVCNGAIQGPAFHLTLWSLCRIWEKLDRYKMDTLLIGEIHDCINSDMPPKERDDFFYICREVMTEEVVREFAPWMNVPLVCEPEVCPVDGDWFNKHVLKEQDGVFVPADVDKWKKKCGEWV